MCIYVHMHIYAHPTPQDLGVKMVMTALMATTALIYKVFFSKTWALGCAAARLVCFARIARIKVGVFRYMCLLCLRDFQK